VATARFRSEIQIQGVNPYVIVEAAVARRLRRGWRRPMPVIARLNGKPREGWRINLMPIGDGRFYLYLHGDARKQAGAEVGDRADIELRFDEDYTRGPAHPMPTWFKEALDACPEARRSWDALPPSRQKEVVRYFVGLKSPEAQQRNLEKALHVLSGRPGRFMGRDWNALPASPDPRPRRKAER
jgi:hypothetical protein